MFWKVNNAFLGIAVGDLRRIGETGCNMDIQKILLQATYCPPQGINDLLIEPVIPV